MKSRRARSTKRGPEYHVTVSFQAPLDFVFAWCTDYTPEDASLEDESYTRKVIERTPRRVVFEDLEETDTGWDWSRAVVSLRPPSRWHMDGVGNRVDVVADYLLTKLPDGRTRGLRDACVETVRRGARAGLRSVPGPLSERASR